MITVQTVGAIYLVSASTSPAAEVGWTYRFPYGANNTCECETTPALGEYFDSETECMKAYAEDQYQWCLYQGTGIFDSQCDDVVAIVEGVTNDLCSSMCTSLVAGTLSLDEFEASCKFNFYADFGDEVAVGWTSCFSNLVYGWSDYDPSNSIQAAPLRIFSSVEGPAQCQALCQAVEDCAYWTWRAYPDENESAQAFQNPPLTCLVYGEEYINGVLNTVMPTSDVFATPTPYCNFPEIPDCMVDPFGRESVSFLEPYSCLMCGCTGKCAWKSPYHLSGAAFCEPEYRDECAYKRPVWTSTLPPCETEDIATQATETSSLIVLEHLSETTVELEQTTTIELEQSDVTFPETVGTSMNAEAAGDAFTEAVTMGTSMSVSASSVVSEESGTATGNRVAASLIPADISKTSLFDESQQTMGTSTTKWMEFGSVATTMKTTTATTTPA